LPDEEPDEEPDFEPDEEPDLDPGAPEEAPDAPSGVDEVSEPPELSDDPDPSPDELAADVAFEVELDRSFLAQPEPLKWTAGGTMAFRSVSSAPQAGQKRGAGASIPWMNSVRVEQVEQT
jgi:hypothetical protein